MKVFAILLAVANLAVVAPAALLLWFIAAFPWENSDPEENDWLLPVAAILAGSAAALLVCIALNRWQGAEIAFLAQTVIVLALLGVTFDESDDSAGTITAIAFVIELVAGSAVLLSRSYGVTRRRTI